MLHLTVVSPKGKMIDEDVDSFSIPTEKGPLMIEKGYTNLVASCSSSGVMKIVKDGKAKYFALFGASLSVIVGKAIITCELCEDGYSIDMARAIAGRDRALDRLEKKDPNIEVKRAKASLARQLARIKAKTLDEGGR